MDGIERAPATCRAAGRAVLGRRSLALVGCVPMSVVGGAIASDSLAALASTAWSRGLFTVTAGLALGFLVAGGHAGSVDAADRSSPVP